MNLWGLIWVLWEYMIVFYGNQLDLQLGRLLTSDGKTDHIISQSSLGLVSGCISSYFSSRSTISLSMVFSARLQKSVSEIGTHCSFRPAPGGKTTALKIPVCCLCFQGTSGSWPVRWKRGLSLGKWLVLGEKPAFLLWIYNPELHYRYCQAAVPEYWSSTYFWKEVQLPFGIPSAAMCHGILECKTLPW